MQFKPLVGVSSEYFITLLNTLVLFLVLKKILFKRVLKVIDDREKSIKDDIETGERAKEEGIKYKTQYESRVSEARGEGQLIVEAAKKRAEEKSQEIIAAAKQEAQSIKVKASNEIQKEREQAANDMKREISEVAVMVASKVIEKDIDKSKHEELINEFIEEVGEVK